MNLDRAISEPLHSVIAFHNNFNRQVKFCFSSLAATEEQAKRSNNGKDGPISLPTGGEPWGHTTRWPGVEAMMRSAETFIAELGIARAHSAFDHYITGAVAECDRAALALAKDGNDGVWRRLTRRLAMVQANAADEIQMVEFFECARNCVVHRSGMASNQLAQLAAPAAVGELLARWPRRVGKWQAALPVVVADKPVAWQPRHAIMASDAVYRLAVKIDAALVGMLGATGMVRMAAHWALFDDSPIPSKGKQSASVRVRWVLSQRYHVGEPNQADIIARLKEIGRWDAARTMHAALVS